MGGQGVKPRRAPSRQAATAVQDDAHAGRKQEPSETAMDCGGKAPRRHRFRAGEECRRKGKPACVPKRRGALASGERGLSQSAARECGETAGAISTRKPELSF